MKKFEDLMGRKIEKYIEISPNARTKIVLGEMVKQRLKRLAILNLLENKLSRRYAKSTAKKYAKEMETEINEILNTDS